MPDLKLYCPLVCVFAQIDCVHAEVTYPHNVSIEKVTSLDTFPYNSFECTIW